MRARGVNRSTDELRRRLELDDDRRRMVAERVQSRGLSTTLSDAAIALERLATTTSNRLHATSLETEDVFEDMCRELRMIADVILVVAALDAIGCTFGCALCCLIALAFGLVGALMLLFIDFVC